jgi:hypothetical protein
MLKKTPTEQKITWQINRRLLSDKNDESLPWPKWSLLHYIEKFSYLASLIKIAIILINHRKTKKKKKKKNFILTQCYRVYLTVPQNILSWAASDCTKPLSCLLEPKAVIALQRSKGHSPLYPALGRLSIPLKITHQNVYY